MQKRILAIAALLLTGGVPVSADDVIEQIDVGRENYVEGDYAAAITELEFALNALRNKLSDLLIATMPDPPALWTAEQAMLNGSATLIGGGIMVARKYNERKGNGKVKVELVVDSPMIQAFSAVLANPIMVANEPQIERIRLGEMSALMDWNPEASSGKISLSIGGRVLAKVEGNDLTDKDILVELMKSWDLKAVKDVAGL